MRLSLAGALLASSAVAISCSRGRDRQASAAAAATAGPSSWELVYEREVNGAMDLFVIPAGGGLARRLTDHPAYDSLARWTLDGRSIVFTSDRTGRPQLWEIDADGRNLRRLRANDATESQADVAPDGRLVAHELATGKETTLVDWPALNYDPVYSPDGSELAFASNLTGQYAIYRQRLSDGKAWRVTFEPGEARNPDYRPSSSRREPSGAPGPRGSLPAM